MRTSPLVNEGGGLHVDGEGTVLLTDRVQRDPDRNPGLAEAYPDRTVELVDARDVFAFGCGIHCITQHQPAAQ